MKSSAASLKLLQTCRPLSPRCLNLIPRQRASNARCISGTARRNGTMPKLPANHKLGAGMKMPTNPGMRSQMKSKGSKALPNDVGLMQHTYIRPPSKDMPGFFTSPRTRLRLEYLSIRAKMRDFFSLIVWHKWLSKPRRKLRFKERREVAMELHKKLYTALAQKDLQTLKKICCQGLLESSQVQIVRRESEPPKEWKLLAYRGYPFPEMMPWPFMQLFPGAAVRVVCDRSAPIPGLKDAGIRQTTIRIKSVQGLETPGQERVVKSLKEYLVIQKLTLDGEEGPWKIWGTTTETSTEEAVKQANAAVGGPGIVERLNAVAGR